MSENIAKRTVLRSCCACRRKDSKDVFIRIVRMQDREAVIDKTGKYSGRGAYLCRSVRCLEKAKRSKALERSLKGACIPEDLYERIKNECLSTEQKD